MFWPFLSHFRPVLTLFKTPKQRFGILLPSETPPPPVWQKTRLFPVFVLCTLPLGSSCITSIVQWFTYSSTQTEKPKPHSDTTMPSKLLAKTRKIISESLKSFFLAIVKIPKSIFYEPPYVDKLHISNATSVRKSNPIWQVTKVARNPGSQLTVGRYVGGGSPQFEGSHAVRLPLPLTSNVPSA